MKIEINIARNGKMRGTLGWLAEGLQSGEIFFSEGNLKLNGNHGLWIKSKDGKISQFLAGYHQFEGDGTYAEVSSNRYEPDIDIGGIETAVWTDAAKAAIDEVVQVWCDELNEYIENEEDIEIYINRVDIKEP